MHNITLCARISEGRMHGKFYTTSIDEDGHTIEMPIEIPLVPGQHLDLIADDQAVIDLATYGSEIIAMAAGLPDKLADRVVMAWTDGTSPTMSGTRVVTFDYAV